MEQENIARSQNDITGFDQHLSSLFETHGKERNVYTYNTKVKITMINLKRSQIQLPTSFSQRKG